MRIGDSFGSTVVVAPEDVWVHCILTSYFDPACGVNGSNSTSLEVLISATELIDTNDPSVAFTYHGASATPAGAGGTDTRLGRQFAAFGEYFGGDLAMLQTCSGALSDPDRSGVLLIPDSVRAAFSEVNGGGSVPEPGGLSLSAAALAALVLTRWRRQT